MIEFIGGAVEENTGTTNGNISINHGIPIQAGDLVIAVHTQDVAVGATFISDISVYNYLFEPTEYEEDHPDGSSDSHFKIWYRIAQGLEETYAFSSNNTSQPKNLLIAVFRGVDKNKPFDVLPSLKYRNWNGGSLTATTPSVYCNRPGNFGVAVYLTDGDVTYSDYTQGYTNEVEDAAMNKGLALVSKEFTTRGTKPGPCATLDGSNDWSALHFMLRTAEPLQGSRFALVDPLPDTRILNVTSGSRPDPLIGVATDATVSVVSSFGITHGLSLVPGDVLIAVVHWNGDGNITSTGSVFTEEFEEENPTGSTGETSYWSRIVDGSEGDTFTWGTTVAAVVEIAIVQFRGVDIADIWEVDPSTNQRVFGEPVTELIAPVINTTVPSIGLVIVFGDHNSDAPAVYSNGYKQAIHATVTQTIGIAYKVHNTPVKQNLNLTFGTNNDWTVHHIALKLKPNPVYIDVKVPIEISAIASSGNVLEITLVDAGGTALPNLTGLSWAWFDQSTPDTAVAPTDKGTGETTDGTGLLSIEIPNSVLSAGQTGSIALMDSTGYIYAWYRVTL